MREGGNVYPIVPDVRSTRESSIVKANSAAISCVQLIAAPRVILALPNHVLQAIEQGQELGF